MTTHPEALRLAAELDDGYPLTGDAISAAAELRSQHARITELEAQLEAIGAGGVGPLRNAAQETEATHLRELAAPSTDQVEEILRERDDADDFIDALLDEVLGPERPEWSSAYGRADALNDVRERMTALHKPAVDKAWDRFQSAMEAPQQPAPSPAPAEWLEQASREGWAACRDSEFVGEEAEEWSFGSSQANGRMIDIQQAAPTAQADTQPAPVLDYQPLPEAELNAQGTSMGMLPHYEQVSTKYASDPDVVKFYTADQMRAYVDADRAARAAPQPDNPWQRALEIRTAHGWRPKGDRIPVLYTDTINGEGVGRDDLWLCTTSALAAPRPATADALDAARYRWLRERSSTMFVRISINGEGAEIAATLDSAVDSARKQGGAT